MSNIIIQKDETFLPNLKKALQFNQDLTNWDLFTLLFEYKRATLIADFDDLQVLSYLPHMTFLSHQIETAKKVIADMNGRAILADEVGLGKTIEAGLILKEYLVRGLVKNALLLVPSSLVNQWIKELQDKFHIQAASYRKNYRWDSYPIFVTSIDLAKRSPHREQILDLQYDLVIVDEAHKLKNKNTLNYSFVQSLQKKFCLLLTATPIQNNLLELFNLVSIVKPGYLGNQEVFKKEYIHTKDEERKKYLHQLIQKVMVRNRRKDTILQGIKRNIHTVWLELTDEEQTVYGQLEHILETYPTFMKITYLKELCSSREACYLSLQQSKNATIHTPIKPILERIATLPHHRKAKKVLEILHDIGNEKVIIFTEYRATQFYLQWYLKQHGITAVSFYGGLKRGRKDWIKEIFKHQVQVLIATEAGGEGINLQFCRYIINYDLPWNPMRLEQRIGRIHRYGQKHHIHVYNFALKNTLEEHIMKLLYEKIEIFERVIGRLDQILATLNIRSIDDEMNKLIEGSNSIGEMQVKLDNFVHVFEHFAEGSDG